MCASRAAGSATSLPSYLQPLQPVTVMERRLTRFSGRENPLQRRAPIKTSPQILGFKQQGCVAKIKHEANVRRIAPGLAGLRNFVLLPQSGEACSRRNRHASGYSRPPEMMRYRKIQEDPRPRQESPKPSDVQARSPSAEKCRRFACLLDRLAIDGSFALRPVPGTQRTL